MKYSMRTYHLGESANVKAKSWASLVISHNKAKVRENRFTFFIISHQICEFTTQLEKKQTILTPCMKEDADGLTHASCAPIMIVNTRFFLSHHISFASPAGQCYEFRLGKIDGTDLVLTMGEVLRILAFTKLQTHRTQAQNSWAWAIHPES